MLDMLLAEKYVYLAICMSLEKMRKISTMMLDSMLGTKNIDVLPLLVICETYQLWEQTVI